MKQCIANMLLMPCEQLLFFQPGWHLLILISGHTIRSDQINSTQLNSTQGYGKSDMIHDTQSHCRQHPAADYPDEDSNSSSSFGPAEGYVLVRPLRLTEFERAAWLLNHTPSASSFLPSENTLSMEEASVTIANNVKELKVKEAKERSSKDCDDYSPDSAESPEEGRKHQYSEGGVAPKTAASRYILAGILELRSSLPIMFRCPRNPPRPKDYSRL